MQTRTDSSIDQPLRQSPCRVVGTEARRGALAAKEAFQATARRTSAELPAGEALAKELARRANPSGE